MHANVSHPHSLPSSHIRITIMIIIVVIINDTPGVAAKLDAEVCK